MIIKHLGKITSTGQYISDFKDKDYNRFIKNLKSKPTLEEVSVELFNLFYGPNTRDTKTLLYFTEALRRNVKVRGNKYTINEFIKSKELVGHAISKMNSSSLYDLQDNIATSADIRKFFTLSSGDLARRVGGFKISHLNKIFKEYPPINGNYYDFSCGWGSRVLGSLKYGLNYYGTDPNHKLVSKLEEMLEFVRRVILKVEGITTDIRCTGSEIFHPDWEGKMGLAFSSPPYFDIEQYGTGKQSYKPGTTYDSWLENYKLPTIQNIHRYLIKGGTFVINTKSYKHAPIESDVVRIAKEVGFKHKRSSKLVLGVRPEKKYNGMSIEEGIHVFKK